MLGWAGAETHVGRLRLGPAGLDGPTAQARAAGQLRLARLAPPGLPPSAVLCVRHLHDPAPGQLRLGGNNRSLTPPPAWEQAVRDQLGTVARTAVRPAHDWVPANVAAVLFADQAELLGCLAADLASGDAGQRWWWRSLFAGRTPEAALRQAWLAAPEALPASLEVLTRRDQRAVAVLLAQLFDPAEAAQLVQAMCSVFGLAAVRHTLSSDEVASLAAPGPTPVEGRGVRPPGRVADRARHRANVRTVGAAAAAVAPPPEAPWQSWVPECEAPGLPPVYQALLGIALLLRRAPSVPRQTTFATAVQAWWTHVTSQRPPPLPPPGCVIASPVERATSSRRAVAVDVAAPTQHAPEVPSVAAIDARRRGARDADSPLPPPVAAAVFDAAAPLAPSTAPDVLAEDGPIVVRTRLGGVFYLINVALALGLYGDFTQPAQPGLALPIWDFLSLVGQHLLGRRCLRSDPLWPLLAALAGRTTNTAPFAPAMACLTPAPHPRGSSRADAPHAHARTSPLTRAAARPLPAGARRYGAAPATRSSTTPPGAGWRPPRTWRLPPDWLAPLEDDGRPWRWTVSGGRLQVHHPAGFCILDRPVRATDVTAARVAALVRPYGRPRLVHRPPRLVRPDAACHCGAAACPVSPSSKAACHPERSEGPAAFERVHPKLTDPSQAQDDTRRLRGTNAARGDVRRRGSFVVPPQDDTAPWRDTDAAGGGRRPSGAPTNANAPAAALGRWLDWLVPYVRARLRTALRTDPGVDVGSLVCRTPARLAITPLHLHVHLALDRLPLAIRLAGLDRDPGWVPAAGRGIAFHFDLDGDPQP